MLKFISVKTLRQDDLSRTNGTDTIIAAETIDKPSMLESINPYSSIDSSDLNIQALRAARPTLHSGADTRNQNDRYATT